MQIKSNTLYKIKDRISDEYQLLFNGFTSEETTYTEFKQMPIFQIDAFLENAFTNNSNLLFVSKDLDLITGKILKLDNSKVIVQENNSNLYQIIRKSDLKSIHLA